MPATATRKRHFQDGQLTLWSQADETIASQYGTLDYLEWCCREADRIGCAYVQCNGSPDRVALFLGVQPASPKVLYIGRR
jgi:hypothetical protein